MFLLVLYVPEASEVCSLDQRTVMHFRLLLPYKRRESSSQERWAIRWSIWVSRFCRKTKALIPKTFFLLKQLPQCLRTVLSPFVKYALNETKKVVHHLLEGPVCLTRTNGAPLHYVSHTHARAMPSGYVTLYATIATTLSGVSFQRQIKGKAKKSRVGCFVTHGRGGDSFCEGDWSY